MSGKPWHIDLDFNKRLTLAARRTEKLIDLLIFVGAMREANEIVLFSDKLSGQFPERSRAANAFNTFRHSMAMFEIMRLAAVWDTPSKDKISIPTVIHIVSTPKFIKQAARHAAARLASYPMPGKDDLAANPGLLDWIEKRRTEDQTSRHDEVRALLTEACTLCEQTLKSEGMSSLRHARDNYLAHHIEASEDDEGNATTVRSFHDHDKQAIIVAARDIVHKLHRALNAGSFDWAASQEIAKRNAEELWNGCRFDIPERSKGFMSAADRK